MKRICAWCLKLIGVSADGSDEITHGICESCAAALERQMKQEKWTRQAMPACQRRVHEGHRDENHNRRCVIP